MSVVTHGVVSIEDGKKADTEYQPARKVRVELHFDVPEGQDAEAALTQISALADNHVRRLLGESARPTSKPVADTTTAGSTTTGSSVSSEPPKPVGRKAGPRAPTASTGKPPPIEVKLPPETKSDPTEVSLDAEVIDDFAAPPATAEVKPITDAELHSAAQKKNGEIKNPLAIRALVGEFRPTGTTGPFQLAEIPQARRQEFLTKLSKLT